MTLFRDDDGLTLMGWAAIAVGLLWASLFTLWLGTAPWTDDAFWVLFSLAGVAGVWSGIELTDREYADGAK